MNERSLLIACGRLPGGEDSLLLKGDKVHRKRLYVTQERPPKGTSAAATRAEDSTGPHRCRDSHRWTQRKLIFQHQPGG